MYIGKILRELLKISFIKTIIFNFKYFKFADAIVFPAIIYRSVRFKKLSGHLEIKCPIKSRLIALGGDRVGTIDYLCEKTIWQVSGTIIINGPVGIGAGSRISVSDTSCLELGENFVITSRSSVICHKHIKFGANCLLSWDILIMDTDLHPIYDDRLVRINENKTIEVGNNVWIGCRSVVLKGAKINDGSIIAAGAIITSNFSQERVIIAGAGNSQRIVKQNITWRVK